MAQVVIPMEEDGGVYKVPCVVNGAKMKLIFDTGAANVCLSLSMAEYLFDNEYITINDFVGSGKSQVADGRIVNHLKLILRDIEIGGKHVKDVEAIVIEEQRAPLLLGQSAIQKLGDVVISGNKLIIKDSKNTLSAADAEKMCNQAADLLENGQFYAAASKYEIVENAGYELSAWHYKAYAMALDFAEEYDKSIAVCLRWINNNQYTEDITSKAFYASELARCYSSSLRHEESNKWYRVAFRCMEGNSDFSDMMRFDMLAGIGRNLSDHNKYEEMIKNNFDKISLLKKSHNLTYDEKKEILINIYAQKKELASYYYNDLSSVIAYTQVMAYYGDEDSIQLCRRHGYSYNFDAIKNYLITY